jgi:hypothetical protein
MPPRAIAAREATVFHASRPRRARTQSRGPRSGSRSPGAT